VDPLIDVQVNGGAVQQLDPILGQRPAKALGDPRQLGRVLLQGGDDAGFATAGAADDEMQADEGLPGSRRAGDICRIRDRCRDAARPLAR